MILRGRSEGGIRRGGGRETVGMRWKWVWGIEGTKEGKAGGGVRGLL